MPCHQELPVWSTLTWAPFGIQPMILRREALEAELRSHRPWTAFTVTVWGLEVVGVVVGVVTAWGAGVEVVGAGAAVAGAGVVVGCSAGLESVVVGSVAAGFECPRSR